eukprot:6321918-Pyramimonas_sp.AAC.1
MVKLRACPLRLRGRGGRPARWERRRAARTEPGGDSLSQPTRWTPCWRIWTTWTRCGSTGRAAGGGPPSPPK